MLKRRFNRSRSTRAAQRGIVLIVALVVLVALTIAGIAMVRSVDTATLVSGNLAFQQAATHSADIGVEEALAMLEGKATEKSLDTSDATWGYSATLAQADKPVGNQTWAEYWQASLAGIARRADHSDDTTQIYYVVHRACAAAKPPGAGGECVSSPAITSDSLGNGAGSDDIKLKAATAVYFRITVRVSGPRRTESYVQSYVAM